MLAPQARQVGHRQQGGGKAWGTARGVLQGRTCSMVMIGGAACATASCARLRMSSRCDVSLWRPKRTRTALSGWHEWQYTCSMLVPTCECV